MVYGTKDPFGLRGSRVELVQSKRNLKQMNKINSLRAQLFFK